MLKVNFCACSLLSNLLWFCLAFARDQLSKTKQVNFRKLVPRVGILCISASLTRSKLLRELLAIEPYGSHSLARVTSFQKLAEANFQKLVPRVGIEPTACGIEAHCSNPLSYRGVFICRAANKQLSIINYQLSLDVKSLLLRLLKW